MKEPFQTEFRCMFTYVSSQPSWQLCPFQSNGFDRGWNIARPSRSQDRIAGPMSVTSV